MNLFRKGILSTFLSGLLAIGTFTTPILLPVGVASLMVTQTSCDKDKTLQQAAEAAKDIGGGTRDVIRAVGEAYQAKLITLEQKDRFADLLKKVAQGGQKGVAAIEALNNLGVTNPNAEQRRTLTIIFDDQVVAPFLELLTEISNLSDSQSAAIRAAMSTIRTAIVLFSSKIGRTDVIDAIRSLEVINV